MLFWEYGVPKMNSLLVAKKKNQLTHTTYVGPTRGKVLEHENTLFQHIHYMTES